MPADDHERRLQAALDAFEETGDEAALDAIEALVAQEDQPADPALDQLDGVLADLRGEASDADLPDALRIARETQRATPAPAPLPAPPASPSERAPSASSRWIWPAALAASALLGVAVWSLQPDPEPPRPALRGGEAEAVALATWQAAADAAVRAQAGPTEEPILVRLHLGADGSVTRVEQVGESDAVAVTPEVLDLPPAPPPVRGATYEVWVDGQGR